MLKFRRASARGYLGPIGDDIPSLIPIIVGLLTFFAAFTFALNEYNHRSQSFAADRDTLIIANTLKGDSYIATFEEWNTSCAGLRVRGLNYVAGVVESSQWNLLTQEAQTNLEQLGNGDPGLSFIANHIFSVPDSTETLQPLACATGIETPLRQEELSTALQSHPYVVLALPLALETPAAVVPATLVVISWRI